MIFDCPTCGAENGVPVSSVGAEGHVLRCRRCNDAFRVYAPEDELTEQALEEPTQALMGDDSWVQSDTDMRELVGVVPEITTSSNVPTTELEDPQLPDIDDSFNETHEESAEPTVAASVEDDGPEASPGFVSFMASRQSLSPPRSTTQAPLPEVVRSASPPPPPEPSVVLRRRTASFRPAARGPRRVAGLVEQAPLALKAALVVFPVAFGITLLVSPGAPADPIPIAPADRSPTEAPDPKGDGTTAADGTKEALVTGGRPGAGAQPVRPDAAAATPPAGLPTDVPAPNGHAYIGEGGSKLWSKPVNAGVVVSRLSAGRVVKRFDTVEGWTLVRIPPSGSAGFVPTETLVAQKPLGALARDLAFSGCKVSRSDAIDSCLNTSESALAACLTRCGPRPNTPNRCEMACKMAFANCNEGCRTVRRRRRRRRR